MILYSEDLTAYDGAFSSDVENAIKEVKDFFNVDNLRVFSWDEYAVVIAAEYKVSLPSRGSIDHLILSVEPILIKISLARYPGKAPSIMSDRKNFPKDRLPHLYYSEENEPSTLCLVRDSLNQWFATVTMSDFLLVGSIWFYKAATGTLLNDNNEFDPVRLKYTFGKHVFKYEMFRDIVSENRRLVPDFPAALILNSLYKSDYSQDKAFKSISDIPFIWLADLKKAISKVYYSIADNKVFFPFYSILVWDDEQKIEQYYFTNLPSNYRELCEFLKLRGIDLPSIISALKIAKVPVRVLLPVIHAIRRPYKVIGYNGEYEFFSYCLFLPDDYSGTLEDDTKVELSSHSEPFNVELAQILSNEKREKRTLYIGAGSLGSKMLMHDARIGKDAIGVVDNDNFEQHNLGRHVLFANRIGKNKAEALIEEVKAFYELDNTSNLVYYNTFISEVETSEIQKYSLLIDTTASQHVLQHLSLTNFASSSRYAKCELVDNGEIGLLYVEGTARNPRMDDLVYLACFLATTNFELKQWRRNDANREPETLNIGLGCNSITTVMADDLISLHASAFSQILASGQIDSLNQGLLYLNICRKTGEMFPVISNEYYSVDPFEVIECQNKSGWSLRLFPGLSRQLLDQCKQHGSIETGGILIGVANYKTKIIHVFDIIEEPAGSSGSPVAFNRGIAGLPEQVDSIKFQTGEIIGYIGEWHTHPMNLERLSSQDMQTIEQLKIINKKTPIPTCAVIVTPSKVIPFVYE